MAQRRKKQAAPAISSKGAELPLDLFGGQSADGAQRRRGAAAPDPAENRPSAFRTSAHPATGRI